MRANKAEIEVFLRAQFSHRRFALESVGERSATLSCAVNDADLRPGGTVSGPTMMALADVALYVAILGELGIVPLAVTTSFTINFLRRPEANKSLIAECALLKVGRVLAVGEVTIFSEGSSEAVAHAVGTYSIPPRA